TQMMGGRRSALGRLGDALQRGQLQHELATLGTVGVEAGELPDRQLEQVTLRWQERGEPGAGFVGWLAASAEILGQQWETWTSPELPKRLAEGAAIGGMAGLAGGVFAPITGTAGLIGGLTAGAISHLISDAYRVEAGHSYIEQI